MDSLCFDNAGEPARKNHAIACLTFAEMDNQDTSKLRGKKAVLEHQQKLYEITEQLLEARDVGFLDKAALCCEPLRFCVSFLIANCSYSILCSTTDGRARGVHRLV